MNKQNLIRVLVKLARVQARGARDWASVCGVDSHVLDLKAASRASLREAREAKGYETQARSNNPLKRFAGIG